ncbi:MAG: MgtC/SapB family protein [Brachymonas sp.]|nr:MgtC/SapB family protein [Brachymonas sp.]
MNDLFQHINPAFHYDDILKAFLSLLAGSILGYEREVKNNSAGLKTIALICLGSTIYAILSQNFMGDGDSFSIAAGIISGIGFLGAGVIYKEGVTIYGLTTAGVIWVAAAVGMAIGFGEVYIALIFLLSDLIVIYFFGRMVKAYSPNYNHRSLVIEVPQQYAMERHALLQELQTYTDYQEQSKLEKSENGQFFMHLDIKVEAAQLQPLEDFLLKHPKIASFSL